ncbi:substrate binding domain-containing protein [Pseudomonas syringae]|uniref:substrate binding domain-containing protein n=1 Tax=Pseudomonas syringae TaxID=317 RepID=UPI00228659B4|nr:substrate binding domain-containing protein [Pseudomonas syringae]
MTDFQRDHPDIRVHLLSTERRVHPIEDGIDVALRVGRVEHEAIIARHLLDYRHVVVASPQFVASYGRPNCPQDLGRCRCATWSLGTNTSTTWCFPGLTVEPNAVLSTSDSMHLLHSAMAGEVITELPPFIVKEAIQRGPLVPLLSGYPLPEASLNLLYPAHRHPSTVVRTYLEYCLRRIPWLEEACCTSA